MQFNYYDNSIKVAGDNIDSLKTEKEKTLANLELQQLSSLEQQIQTINTTLISLKSNLTSLKVQMEAIESNSSDSAKNIAIMTEKNNVNTDKVGDYEVIYSITNDKGHNLQRTRRVSVIKTEKAGE